MTRAFNLDCFKSSYLAARQALLAQLDAIPAELLQLHQFYLHPLPDPDNQALYMDWIQLGQSNNPQCLLILICGTHGVEGFTGSAIQLHALPELAKQLSVHPELGIILIHAFNPWGFAWLRRYDHEGIDLNRNFIDFKISPPDNPEYDEVHSALFNATNGQVEPILAQWQSKLGQQAYETIMTRGQYQHSDGLFYGGHSASWSRQTLEQACNTSIFQNAKRIAVIDLHTGLGPFGHGEIINDHVPDSPGYIHANNWYAGNAKSGLLGESCSAPKTGLLDYFWHETIGERGCFITLEFGTYSFDKLLIVLCQEQQYYNHCLNNQHTRDINHASVTALRDYFYPQDHRWRERVLLRASQVMKMALQGIL